MSSASELFAEVRTIAEQAGIEQALARLADHFRDRRMHHELFEVLKMNVRHGLGIPLLYGESADDLDEAGRRRLEDGLLEACREVGTMLVEDGQLHEGWVYIQPVGDRELSRNLITSVPVTDENIDALVEIAFSGGAAPDFGYDLVLKKYGTCNAITTIDTRGAQFDAPTRRQIAAMLVNHLYDELCANVCSHIEQEKGEGTVAEGASLRELMAAHPWITAGGSHHVDATHLASVMRIGLVVEDGVALKRLVELAAYGASLASDFQYAGNPPFENTYPDSQIYYRALLGEKVDEAVAHFDRKAKETDRGRHGSIAIDTLIDLLKRVGRRQQALDIAFDQLESDETTTTANVHELAESGPEMDSVMKFFQQRNDLLGYSVGLLRKLDAGENGS
ncbi:MAG: hypothetical protein AAF456_15725 [Planctomycetota bacterium]